MRHNLILIFWVVLIANLHVGVESASSEAQQNPVKGKVYYVRQTVGNDANDGLSPQTAWRHISKLRLMQAGDTTYIGPGLYRETIFIMNDGTAESRVRFIADSAGKHTGDPPGVVMITGADPVDEEIFSPHSEPGVYWTKNDSTHDIRGVVEMDGLQNGFAHAVNTKGHLVDKLSELTAVEKLPSSFYYDPDKKIVYIRTSDGKPPAEHEIEFLRRKSGFEVQGRHFIMIAGFVFRHMGGAGIVFSGGSSNGIAVNNISYGSYHGIGVYNATNIHVYGNVLFRNYNSGVYFLNHSTNGYAIGNTLYENIKGLRWSSESLNGLAIGNTTFDNHEAGISIEHADDILVTGNKLVNNRLYQLMVIDSQFHSEGNCFENGTSDQLTAQIDHFKKYSTLEEYHDATLQDNGSREGECGPLSEKIDVLELHDDTKNYTERAREIIRKSSLSSTVKIREELNEKKRPSL